MYGQIFDLIISDIMMPGIDGYEFARTVRELNQEIPILFVTAKDDFESKRKGFRLIYVFAAYSFYCIGMAIRNMAKHRKLETPVLAAAKMLSFACALMSILATQTAMLTQFGDGNTAFARIMNAATGSVVCLLIFGLALWMVRRANKEIRKMGE